LLVLGFGVSARAAFGASVAVTAGAATGFATTGGGHAAACGAPAAVVDAGAAEPTFTASSAGLSLEQAANTSRAEASRQTRRTGETSEVINGLLGEVTPRPSKGETIRISAATAAS